jgi:DNA-binding NarL/FixJ family response regulator
LGVTTILRSRWTGTLLAGFIALSVAILASLLLPGRAEAQEQAANTNTTTVVSGDSLWTIAQARLTPDATPQQVADEVERMYALNRDQLGGNPNLLLVGQELLVSPVVGEEPRAGEPAISEEGSATAAAAEPAFEQQPAGEGSAEVNVQPAPSATGSEARSAAAPAEEVWPSSEPEDVVGGAAGERKMLGWGILLLTVLIVAIMAWRLPLNRSLSGSYPYYAEIYYRYGENYAAWFRYQEQKEEEEQVTEIEISETEEAETPPEISAASAGTRQAKTYQHRLRPEFDGRTPKLLGERSVSEDDVDSYWDPARDPGKSRLMMTVQPTTLGCEAWGSFWVKYPSPLVVLKIEAELKAAGYACYGEAVPKEEVPVNDAPSSMIYCPKEDDDGDDVAHEVERLRSAAGNIPIVVLGSRLDPQLAQRVLVAGAAGIVNLERYPEQGAGFLTAAFEDETAISRDFLETILAEATSRTGPIVLTSGQRSFLELVVEAPIVADNIMVPKELLRAFLVKVEGRLDEEEPFSSMEGRSPVA